MSDTSIEAVACSGAVGVLFSHLRLLPSADVVWTPPLATKLIDSAGNGLFCDALPQGANDYPWCARSSVRSQTTGQSLNESFFKWYAWLDHEEPAEMIMGDVI